MSTEKLFYQDSYMQSCTAVVQECRPYNNHYAVVLDRTCFYPEGGGQPGDTGALEQVRVFDTQEEDGLILHYTNEPVESGISVTASIDWSRRFDLMQQHSGEHMISGVIHRRYGFENVGFHMGTDVITIDFNGELSFAELIEVEEEVNERIWKNDSVHVWYPEPEELVKIPYRSKKELTGQVRLVEFPGADICACCGTHVDRTGAIGLVKIISCEKFHSGVRVELLCGGRAADYLRRTEEQNRQISRRLSAPPMATARAVAALAEQTYEKSQRIYRLEEALFAAKANELANAGNVVVFLEDLSSDGVRRACDAIQNTCGGCAAVFSGDDGTGYRYAAGLPGGDLGAFTKAMNAALKGRGGGRPFFVQGSVQAGRAQILEFFRNAWNS